MKCRNGKRDKAEEGKVIITLISVKLMADLNLSILFQSNEGERHFYSNDSETESASESARGALSLFFSRTTSTLRDKTLKEQICTTDCQTFPQISTLEEKQSAFNIPVPHTIHHHLHLLMMRTELMTHDEYSSNSSVLFTYTQNSS